MRVINEICSLKQARHPNIVMMIGMSISDDDNLLILTELCEQRSLKHFIQKYKGKIAQTTKFKILFDLAKALFYMHSLSPKVIHRDIKLDNIFVTAEFKAKLGDFG